MVLVGAYCIRHTNIHDHGQMIDPPDTCWGVCNTPLPIRYKYLINMYLLNLITGKDWMVRVKAYCIRPTNAHDHWQMIDQPDTFWGVCNMPIPIRDKCLRNMYLLNPIPGKDWIVRVGAYCIRPTGVHNHGKIINLPGTFWGVCDTPLPIQDKYLIDTYLLNLIPGKDWIIGVESCCIFPKNSHDHGQIINPPDTFWGVCNMPLPIRDKNLILLWTMNLKLGTCWSVCNTPLPRRDKFLINTYLLNLIPDENWIVRVGAYYIRPTNAHDHGQMIDPPNTFWVVCNTPLHIRIKNLIPIYRMNQKPGTCWGVCNTTLLIPDKSLINTYLSNFIPSKDWIICVGAYCIRPTNTHDYGQMIDPPDTCWGVCNTPLSLLDKYLINIYLLNHIPGENWIVRVGVYCILPTNSHNHGLMMDQLDTFRGVCNTPLSIRNKYLINTYLLNPNTRKD